MNGAKHRFALGLTCFFLIGITVVYPFLLYTPNAFVTRWREWYIETAMGTMTHQWLATWFIPENIINEVMTKRYLMNAEAGGHRQQLGRRMGARTRTPPKRRRSKFYAMFSELDRERASSSFCADNPEYHGERLRRDQHRPDRRAEPRHTTTPASRRSRATRCWRSTPSTAS